MREKQAKNGRTLDMYERLCEGKLINKAQEAELFGVDERTIQRDIDDIRAFLSNRNEEGDKRRIEYDRGKKGFVMQGNEVKTMTNSEILAVTKILLESRAFTKKEIDGILNKMVENCVPLENMKLVSELIANEKYHYVELHHKSLIQDKLWKLGENIREHQMLEIRYTRAEKPKESVVRVIEPVALLFSEYYFYLNAYIVEKNVWGKYVHKYDYPAIFRLDRIKSYKELDKKYKLAYSSRFEEGEFRKRIQFMYPGRLMKIQLKFYGANPEPVLDRLPTASIVKQTEEYSIVEAEVYGNGIVMWILSQGSRIEVLKPDSLREEMKKVLSEMLERY